MEPTRLVKKADGFPIKWATCIVVVIYDYRKDGGMYIFPGCIANVNRILLIMIKDEQQLDCTNPVPTDFYKGPIVPLPELRISSNKMLKNLQQYDTIRVFQTLFKSGQETKQKMLFLKFCFLYYKLQFCCCLD